MRIIAAGLLAAALAAVSAFPAFAGAWTNISPNGWQTNRLFYIGDDGQYAKSKWVMHDGVWYWITADGTRANSVGIADDGYIYDANGVWVPSANSGNSYRKNGTGPVPNGGTVTPNSGGYRRRRHLRPAQIRLPGKHGTQPCVPCFFFSNSGQAMARFP